MGTTPRKKNYKIFLWIAIPLLLYLFYIQIDRKEVGETNFVEILCIDREGDVYTITGFYDNAASKNDDGLKMIDGTGDSVYTAYMDMSRKNAKDLSLDHTEYFLLSEQAATLGLEHCLDFISREPDMKTNAKLFVLKTKNANKLLDKALEKEFAPSDTLNAISNKQTNNLKKPMNTLLQVLNDMEHNYNNLLLPYLVYEDESMYLDGYATFKNGRLYSYLGHDLSQAVDLYRNNLRTCPLDLSSEICVQLLDIVSTPQVDVIDDSLNINMKVKAESTVKQATNITNVFEEETRTRIAELERYRLTENLLEIIFLMKTEKLDLLNIGTLLEKKADALPANTTWDSYINNMEVSLTIELDTAKTYTLETD